MTYPPSTSAETSRLGRIRLREELFVLGAALAASLSAILWSWTHSAFLLYGDAEAHIHIARRLFDSHRPGLTQLGSVWLPLPHLLMVPFLAIDAWWRSGFGPAIPSAACYVLGCLGLYRLARKWLQPVPAALALAFFAANPNLLYLQTTAMTEPLFLCELIWAVLLLIEWRVTPETEGGRKARLLWAVIAVLISAVLTRYDGWILALFAWIAMAVSLFRRRRLLEKHFLLASLLLLAAPITWMVYNQVVFGDWLDFLRGPYSARAIELRTSTTAVDPHPGWHNPWVALVYFVKASEMDAVQIAWGGIVLAVALFGTIWALRPAWRPRSSASLSAEKTEPVLWLLFLWLPLPFYAYSVSYGSVPIFLPVWKPFSWYNTRYGMELLPALALFAGFAVAAVWGWLGRWRPRYRLPLGVFLSLLLIWNFAVMLREGPLTFVEAQKNSAARGYYNSVIPAALAHLHQLDANGVVLMNTSMYPSFISHSGLTYSQTVNESDKEWYWAALGAPAAHADIVLAFAGDEIDKAVHAHPEHLRVYQRFHSPNQGWDQADATLYLSDTFPAAGLTPPSPGGKAR
jgi:4-amino-4-deoxy-L-arabinose transferase-like glycosyltransferase